MSDNFVRATPMQCVDAAQQFLEQAVDNMAELAKAMTVNAQKPSGIPVTDLIAFAEMQIRLGLAWAELAETKRVMGGAQ